VAFSKSLQKSRYAFLPPLASWKVGVSNFQDRFGFFTTSARYCSTNVRISSASMSVLGGVVAEDWLVVEVAEVSDGVGAAVGPGSWLSHQIRPSVSSSANAAIPTSVVVTPGRDRCRAGAGARGGNVVVRSEGGCAAER
jgi:hypothetical protein